MVDPILCFSYGIVRYSGNVLYLRDKASHQRVLLFIRASFARGIWMGEVDTALVECIRKATELTAVVAGDALENLRERYRHMLFGGHKALPPRPPLSCRGSDA